MGGTALVTGSSGLVGSETAEQLDSDGWVVHGLDNNMRADFFGPGGDTRSTLEWLRNGTKRFSHHELDVRDRAAVQTLVEVLRSDLIVHAAAQPSHDLAASRPFDDFDVNAVGTLNLLESARWVGVVPACLQFDEEYGRYFGMPTVCFRGGCLTGRQHAGVPLHGFLAYLARAVREGLQYQVFGYGAKQVRDNLHSVDVCGAILAFAERPKVAAVYNLGGGRDNSVSMLEAIARFEELYERKLEWEYVDEPRIGDHICYISDLGRLRTDYPEWSVTVSLDAIFDDFVRTSSPAAS